MPTSSTTRTFAVWAGRSFAWAWTTNWLGVFQPMAWTLFEAEYAVFGLEPARLSPHQRFASLLGGRGLVLADTSDGRAGLPRPAGHMPDTCCAGLGSDRRALRSPSAEGRGRGLGLLSALPALHGACRAGDLAFTWVWRMPRHSDARPD